MGDESIGVSSVVCGECGDDEQMEMLSVAHRFRKCGYRPKVPLTPTVSHSCNAVLSMSALRSQKKRSSTGRAKKTQEGRTR